MDKYISTYALYHPNDGYLEHGLSWGKHRYIKRTGTPGNYKYTYAEDLRNAGRNLASGARNLVSRAGAAARRVGYSVGYVTGATQKKRVYEARANYRTARDNADKAWRLVDTHARRADNDLKRNYQDTSSPSYASALKRARRVNGQLYDRYDRAVDAENKARQEVNDAELAVYNAPLKRAIRAVRDLPFNISLEVEDQVRKVKDKIGIDYRSSIMKARRNLELEQRYSRPGDYSLTKAQEQYDNAIRNYGQTFIGNMERILNTQFYDEILRKA